MQQRTARTGGLRFEPVLAVERPQPFEWYTLYQVSLRGVTDFHVYFNVASALLLLKCVYQY